MYRVYELSLTENSPLLPAGPIEIVEEAETKPIQMPIDSPMIPASIGCVDDEYDDSGCFMDDEEILDAF